MSRRSQVFIPDRAADRPSALGTIATALLALCAGFVTAYALRDRSAQAPEQVVATVHAGEPLAAGALAGAGAGEAIARADEPAIAVEPAPAPAPREPAGEPVREAQPEPEPAEQLSPEAVNAPPAEAPAMVEPEPPAQLPVTREPEPMPVPAPHAAVLTDQPSEAETQSAAIASAEAEEDQRFKTGIVAYLRCDGLPQAAGPYPCPRDRALERRAWQVLRALPNCAPLAEAHGAGEVRLELTRNSTELHVVSGELDFKAVRQCAAGLAALRTSLRPTRMIVAFRFQLRSVPAPGLSP